jgi:hypothetical protein
LYGLVVWAVRSTAHTLEEGLMRTPAGKECSYFYGDYYRGRQLEECRLLQSAMPPLRWQPDFCQTCPVPGILQSNACVHMVLIPSLERPFPFIKQHVRVKTMCSKSEKRDFDPHVGCGQCHPLPPEFFGGSS